MAEATSTPVRDGKRHERLKAWIACHELALAVYRCSRDWPPSERYALTSQARSAAYSAAANTFAITVGSMAELSYVLILARDQGYLPGEVFGEVEALRDHASPLTWGL